MMFEKQISFLGKWGWNIIRGSLFWLLGNIPYIFLVLNGLVAETVDEIATLVLTGIILIPFVFSPGTVATFSCVRAFNNEQTESLWQIYKESYKKNYRMSLNHGLFYVMGLFITYAAYWYYGSYHIVGRLIPIFIFLILSLLFLFVLVYTSDREETFLNYWKIGGLLLINHPMFSLFMGTEIVFVLYFCHYIGALLLFVSPGATFLIVYYFYNESVKAELKKLNS